MLRELSMVERRYQPVREVLDTGATITDVAARLNLKRPSARGRRSNLGEPKERRPDGPYFSELDRASSTRLQRNTRLIG
jgi:hypothetical protein